MITQNYADIVTEELLRGAIENNEYHGFLQDYHVLHCLLRIHKPNTVFELGTNMGRGTSIICNAAPQAQVYSLDLPTEMAHVSLQHPISEGKGDRVGSLCKFPYTQLRGDSLNYDFTIFPAEAYYVDGEHTYGHVQHETKSVLANNPKIVIYHDSDIPEVFKGIEDGLIASRKKSKYELYRVIDTRIAYLLKK